MTEPNAAPVTTSDAAATPLLGAPSILADALDRMSGEREALPLDKRIADLEASTKGLLELNAQLIKATMELALETESMLNQTIEVINNHGRAIGDLLAERGAPSKPKSGIITLDQLGR